MIAMLYYLGVVSYWLIILIAFGCGAVGTASAIALLITRRYTKEETPSDFRGRMRGLLWGVPTCFLAGLHFFVNKDIRINHLEEHPLISVFYFLFLVIIIYTITKYEQIENYLFGKDGTKCS